MSVHEGSLGTVLIERLEPSDMLETFSFLDREPVLNVYLLAVLMRDALAPVRDEFWAARRDGQIAALVMLGTGSGSVLPAGDDHPALDRLAAHSIARLATLPPRFQVIGQRASIAPFIERCARAALVPRLERDQTYMTLERAELSAFEPLPQLRPARTDDRALIYESGARLRAEELDDDPRSSDPLAYSRRVDEECRDSLTFLWREHDELRFRASVSARTADAAQISGVYTPPQWRRRGFAQRGVGELCRRLFEHSRAACLFVNDINAPAIAVYRRLGFTPRGRWGSAFYERAPERP